MIRVLIADDHVIVREGLKAILHETEIMKVVGEASDGTELVTLAKRVPCEVVLLDIGMPGRGWLEVLQQVKSSHPSLPVLILSVNPEEQYAVRALKAGASGYLNKSSAPEELVNAIEAVVGGRKYVSPSLAQALATSVGSEAPRPLHESLSEREYQVLVRIAQGKSPAEIADDLCLSPKTVSTYRTRILTKLQLSTTAELVHYAFKNGLV